MVDIRLGVFGVENSKSGVTTQHAEELVQKQKTTSILFFFVFFSFFFVFFGQLKQWLKERRKMKRTKVRDDIHWSACAVLLAF